MSSPSSPTGAVSQSKGHQLRKTASISSQLSGMVLETIMDTSERGWGDSHKTYATMGSSNRSRSPKAIPAHDGQESHVEQITKYVAKRPEVVQQKYLSHGEQDDRPRMRSSEVNQRAQPDVRRGSLVAFQTFAEMKNDGASRKSLSKESSDVSEDILMSPTVLPTRTDHMSVNVVNSETGSNRGSYEEPVSPSRESVASVGENGHHHSRRTDHGGVSGSVFGSESAVRDRLLDPQKESELNGMESSHVEREKKSQEIQLDGYAFREDVMDRGAGGGEGGIENFFLETIYSDDGKSFEMQDLSPGRISPLPQFK